MDCAEETLVAETHEPHGVVLAREGDLAAAVEHQMTGVGAQVDSTPRGSDKSQHGTVGDDDGAQGEVMHGDGRDHKTATVGREDGATATKGVGCGACGRGNKEAVAIIGGHEIIVDIEVGAQEVGVVDTVQGDLVEGCQRRLRGGSADVDMQEGTGLDGVMACQEVLDQKVEMIARRGIPIPIFASYGGEEPKVAEIDTHHGDGTVGDKVHGTEQGTIATDGEDEVVMAVRYLALNLLGIHLMAVEGRRELFKLSTE